VSRYDWLLFLHVLGASALVAALTLLSIVIVATWRAERASDIAAFAGITRVGGLLVNVGSLMTIVFGVWLAIDLGRYHVWDGWVIAAIVLWAITAETGRRSAGAYGRIGAEAGRLAQSDDSPRPGLRTQIRSGQAVGLQLASTAAVLVILVDMIWKPGA
jgi:uncharacterized membrane protein